MRVTLAGWENFYVIVGSSAGALTGLMFVVIALTRDLQLPRSTRASRSFATPTIVHFTTALSLAAVLSMPRLTRGAIGAILLAVGAALLAYIGRILYHSRRIEVYQPDLEDKLFHIWFPGFAYVSILVAGALSWTMLDTSLYMVGGSMLALVIIGIHNAWDSAVWMISKIGSS